MLIVWLWLCVCLRVRRKSAAGRPASCSCTCETMMIPSVAAADQHQTQSQQQQQQPESPALDNHLHRTGTGQQAPSHDQNNGNIADDTIAAESLMDDVNSIDRQVALLSCRPVRGGVSSR